MSYTDYIGLPFKEKGRGPDGYDCYGLILLVMESEHGITGLPDFGDQYESTTDKLNIPMLAEREKLNWTKVERPQEGDVVLLNILRQPLHCGIMIDGQNFLHVTKDINSCIESTRSMLWKNRINGFYRYDR